MTRIVFESANGKDLNSLKQTIASLPQIKSLLSDSACAYLRQQYENIDLLEDVYNLIDAAIDPEAPFSIREGGIIKSGFNVSGLLSMESLSKLLLNAAPKRHTFFCGKRK